MKIIGRFALGAVAAAGLVFATSVPAGADVPPHKHCLYIESLDGYVLIAQGVSEKAPNEPALENFHEKVHTGEPGDHLKIIRIGVNDDCQPRFPVP
jgi:hypothetical protein